MKKRAGFKLEKQVVAVPTEFIFLGGIRLSWSEFDASLKALEALAPSKKYPEGIERRDLRHLLGVAYDQNWVKTWQERGVVVAYNYDWDNDGRTVTTEMVKAGVAYKSLMKSIGAFQAKLQVERAEQRRKDRRAHLEAQLAELDRPAKARPKGMRDPFYDPLFAND
jgi:hypothetical protein